MDEASDRDWGKKITIIYKFPPKYLKVDIFACKFVDKKM